MIGPTTKSHWVGLVCDASSASVFVARGSDHSTAIIAQGQVDFDLEELHQRGRITALEQFAAEHQLAGCDVRVAFVGAGTIVQRLTLPPLSTRNRLQAVNAHLRNYAEGRELSIDLALDPRSSRRKNTRLLAAGVDRDLSRAICQACRQAGMRVQAMTALASAFGPATDRGPLVQLVVGERTTTIQLFDDGRLTTCRDVLLGRRDFLQAYQRPILTKGGAVTLSLEEANALARDVGIPVEREDEVRPGVLASQLWPTLNPVLQRLQHEVEQSLVHSQWPTPQDANLALLGLPAIPGLGEFLVTELQLRSSLVSAHRAETDYLLALAGSSRTHVPLDLRPPEERFGERLTKPALAIGVCALLIILGNSFTPREAGARIAELRPLTGKLQIDLDQAHQELTEAQDTGDALVAALRRDGQLSRALPAEVPVVGPLKAVFASMPPGIELEQVQLAAQPPATLEIQAGYQGETPASILGARWARDLGESAFFSEAKVTEVSGSGREGQAVIVIEAAFEGD
jgi:hypothetical protein